MQKRSIFAEYLYKLTLVVFTLLAVQSLIRIQIIPEDITTGILLLCGAIFIMAQNQRASYTEVVLGYFGSKLTCLAPGNNYLWRWQINYDSAFRRTENFGVFHIFTIESGAGPKMISATFNGTSRELVKFILKNNITSYQVYLRGLVNKGLTSLGVNINSAQDTDISSISTELITLELCPSEEMPLR